MLLVTYNIVIINYNYIQRFCCCNYCPLIINNIFYTSVIVIYVTLIDKTI